MLAHVRTVVVIAADSGLRNSLGFALEVEGYCFVAFETWDMARRCDDHAHCTMIIDEDIFRASDEAQRHAADPRNAVVIMVDGLPPLLQTNGAMVITKPLDSAELLRTVRALAAAR